MRIKTKTLIVGVLLALYLLSVVGVASALVVKSVDTNPSEIAPGETSIIKIELENNGDSDITDVSVVLDFSTVPLAPYSSSSEDSIDEIQEDEDETARFRVIALSDAESGIYKIPISISYIDDGEVKTKNSLISLTVNSDPILGIEVDEDLLLKGKRGEIKVRIINKGLSDVRFLEIEFGSSSYIDLLSLGKVYVGDVDSDDFEDEGFKLFFDKKTPDKITVPITLSYRDATNAQRSETFNLQLNVYSRDKAIELGLMKENRTAWYVGIAIVVVVGFFGYRWLKKKKRLKRANSKEGF